MNLMTHSMTRFSRIPFTLLSVAALGLLACGSSEKPTQHAEEASTSGSDDAAENTLPATPVEPAATDGERAQAFSLAGHDGSTHTLQSMLAKGPAVLVFYRGHW